METELTTKDLKLFLINSKKIIFLVTIFTMIISTVFIGYREITNYFSINESSSEEQKINNEIEIQKLLETDPEELTTDEENTVNRYLSEGAYFFRLFIENPDYNSFGRSNLLLEALINEDTLELATKNLDNKININPEYMIHVQQNTENMLHTFVFTTGNKLESKELAESYFQLITNKELEILKDRRIYIFDSPTLINIKDKKNEELDIAPPKPNIYRALASILITLGISFVFGVFFGVFIAFVKEKFNNKIGYLFNYGLSSNSRILNVDNNEKINNEQLKYALVEPSLSKSIILYEPTQKNSNMINKIKENKMNTDIEFTFVTNILEVNPRIDFDEIVLLISIGSTSRKWYNNQLEYLNNNKLSKKIIRLIG